MTTVYILRHGDRPVYVGMTDNLPRRLSEHRPWMRANEVDGIEAAVYDDRTSAAHAEQSLIRLLRPRFNVIGVRADAYPEPAPTFYAMTKARKRASLELLRAGKSSTEAGMALLAPHLVDPYGPWSRPDEVLASIP